MGSGKRYCFNRNKRKKFAMFCVTDWKKRWGITQKATGRDLMEELSKFELQAATDVAKRKIVMKIDSDYGVC